ncbi:hypothetical protein D1816_20065 [Aquimarina sp. AD10]|uniref:hypothetical protein n=1 Tax=Aquimarina sp. AD10 TaxID=1714849 RepID=UPI000E4A99FB|nr:hypothetical protein [Aquimarina sp. AD10]AXT62557.1 hypothetical protein D1816_20065 [Aquimarina sp. AD10]RKM97741.1 hypothetical protein D7033_13380 [Aquimarina sp. AD10]
MKTNKFLFSIFTSFLISIVFISCEVEESTIPAEQIVKDADLNSNETTGKSSLRRENVYRYYSGGSQTMHTYKTRSGNGIGIGSSEGISFSTPVTTNVNSVNSNEFNVLFFMLHPQRKDFVIGSGVGEFLDLKGKGWRDVSGRNYVLIHKKPGNGRKKLHRFYGVANSDHIYTKNYAEGINAGYRYEGVTGWVY